LSLALRAAGAPPAPATILGANKGHKWPLPKQYPRNKTIYIAKRLKNKCNACIVFSKKMRTLISSLKIGPQQRSAAAMRSGGALRQTEPPN
jgi:hypothetical protein